MKHFLAATFLGVMAAGGAYAEGPVDVTNVNKELITSAEGKTYTIATVVKVDGIAWFDRMRDGVKQFGEDTGHDVWQVGPSQADAAAQVQLIENLIAQGVDAIAISANDPDAVVPALKKAQQRGIKVISWDSGVAPEGRIMHLNPSSNELIGKMCLQLAKNHLPDGKGDFAILSATTTSTNQNIWIEEMKKVLPNYANVNLVDTVYGDDLADKSYRETQGLIAKYPNLKAIIAPTSVGIVAAAQAVEDAGLVGKVNVTGLGLPSEMAGHVKAGSSKAFAIWNPIDLGYSATYIAYELKTGKAEAKPDAEISIGRMGKIKLDANNEAAMADPFVYDAGNVEEFAKIF